MATRLYSRIAMLGAAPETRGAIAAVVDAYRTHGLLKRWPGNGDPASLASARSGAGGALGSAPASALGPQGPLGSAFRSSIA